MTLQLCVLILIFSGNIHWAYARPSSNDKQTKTNATIPTTTAPSAGQDLASLGTTYSENLFRNTTVAPWAEEVHAFSWLERSILTKSKQPEKLTPYEMKVLKIVLTILFSGFVCLFFFLIIITVMHCSCKVKDPRDPWFCCDWFRPRMYTFEYENL